MAGVVSTAIGLINGEVVVAEVEASERVSVTIDQSGRPMIGLAVEQLGRVEIYRRDVRRYIEAQS